MAIPNLEEAIRFEERPGEWRSGRVGCLTFQYDAAAATTVVLEVFALEDDEEPPSP